MVLIEKLGREKKKRISALYRGRQRRGEGENWVHWWWEICNSKGIGVITFMTETLS